MPIEERKHALANLLFQVLNEWARHTANSQEIQLAEGHKIVSPSHRHALIEDLLSARSTNGQRVEIKMGARTYDLSRVKGLSKERQ
jgi:hypothetical protein